MTDWMERAACRDADPETFFPERGDFAAARDAKAICAGCDVAPDCLEFALANDLWYGVWGGVSDRERRRIRRRERRRAA